MEEILFVTTNPGKIASANKYINNAKVVAVHVDLIEPRTDDITEIAKIKAEQAFEATGKPCIVLDAGFFVESLNGFPRAYVNHMLDTIGIEGIVKLLNGVENRNAAFRECLVYYDGLKFEYFYGERPGIIAETISQDDHAEQWSPLWRIFIPEGHQKTLSELTAEERSQRYGSVSPFEEFNEFLLIGTKKRVR